MLSKRLLVVAADPKLGRKLALALMAAGGAVTTAESLPKGELGDYDLVVLPVADPAGLELPAGKDVNALKVVPVLVHSDLQSFISLLSRPQVDSVLVLDSESVDPLRQVAARVLFGDIFGIENVLPWGVRTYSCEVRNYQEKAEAIATISEFAQTLGLRRKHRDGIEQVVDELIMNAVYDAPVDASGRPLYTELPTNARMNVVLDQPATVEYGCDGNRFVVSVRDNFGRLTKDVVLRYLDKCLNSAEQIDRKTGGAGLGLYLIANQVTELIFNASPGHATEVVVCFEVGAVKSSLRHVGFYSEQPKPAHAAVPASPAPVAVAAPKRRTPGALPDGPRAPASASGATILTAALAVAIALLTGVIGVLAWPSLRGHATGSIVVHVSPPEAEVYLDGVLRGTAHGGQMLLAKVHAGATHAVRGALAGHADQTHLVWVPSGGQSNVALSLVRERTRVMVTSKPPGAKVTVDGAATGKITPAVLDDLPPGRAHEIAFELEGYARATLTARPVVGEQRLESELSPAPDFALLSVTSDPPGAQVLVGDFPLGTATPVRDYLIHAGRTYLVTVRLPPNLPWTRSVTPTGGERLSLSAKLVLGGLLTLRCNHAAKVLIDKVERGQTPLIDAPLAVGKHAITLIGERSLTESFVVDAQAGKTVERNLEFGLVDAGKGRMIKARGPGLHRQLMLVPVGEQALTVIDREGQQEETVKVKVSANRTTPVR